MRTHIRFFVLLIFSLIACYITANAELLEEFPLFVSKDYETIIISYGASNISLDAVSENENIAKIAFVIDDTNNHELIISAIPVNPGKTTFFIVDKDIQQNICAFPVNVPEYPTNVESGIQKIDLTISKQSESSEFTIKNKYDQYDYKYSTDVSSNELTVISNDESIAKVGWYAFWGTEKIITISGIPVSSGTTEFIVKNKTSGDIIGTIPVIVPENRKSSERTIDVNSELENACFLELSTYFKNPISAQLVRCFTVPCTNPIYSLYLMDISAENSFGGTTTDSYFVVCDIVSKKISAIAFDGMVSHKNDIANQNKMYAKYLALQDGIGDFITNQLQIKITDFAKYIKMFYDGFFK